MKQIATTPSLFPETAQDRAHRVDVLILEALCSKGAYQVSDLQRELLTLLRFRRGLARAITIGEICERLKVTPRTVKQEIADLTVRFRIPIGSSRDASTGGYYLAMTEQECIDSAAPHIHQALAHFRRADVLLDRHELGELCGQLALALSAAGDFSRTLAPGAEEQQREG